MTHYTDQIERLLAYADGSLPASQASEIEAYLATHPDDSQLVDQYSLIRKRLLSDDSVEPSRAAVARALAIFKSAPLPQRERSDWLTAVDRLIARCVFDSRVEALAVRSAAAEQLVNMSFETPNADIDLQVERMSDSASDATDRWQILGQINTTGTTQGAHIVLTQAGSIVPIAESTADAHGAFSIQAATGRYDLHIELSQGVVVLPNLDMT